MTGAYTEDWPAVDGSREDVNDVDAPAADLPTLVRQLAEARRWKATATAELQHLRDAWTDRFDGENVDAIQEAYAAELSVSELDSYVREATLAAYRADPSNKQPAPGVGIRVTTRLTYDEAKAMMWALDHQMPQLLKLNVKAFEKAAPALGLPFVETVSTPSATIASDLGAVLGTEADG